MAIQSAKWATAALITLMASAAVPSIAYAQDATAEDAPQEIVVSALRRDQNLQDVPAAVTAFSAETIENAGIEKPLDFINLTSNVNLVETQNSGNAFIIIRGIMLSQSFSSKP